MTLKSRREDLNISREELAKKAGIALITIGRYERGERKPTLDNLLKFTEILDCTIEDLIEEHKVDKSA